MAVLAAAAFAALAALAALAAAAAVADAVLVAASVAFLFLGDPAIALSSTLRVRKLNKCMQANHTASGLYRHLFIFAPE